MDSRGRGGGRGREGEVRGRQYNFWSPESTVQLSASSSSRSSSSMYVIRNKQVGARWTLSGCWQATGSLAG